MLAFDPNDLRIAGVELVPLPNEIGRLIDVDALPLTFARHLKRHGLDMARPIRVVGIIGRRPDGRPGRYAIHFRQE